VVEFEGVLTGDFTRDCMAFLIAQVPPAEGSEGSEGSALEGSFDFAASWEQYHGDSVVGFLSMLAVVYVIYLVFRNIQSVSTYGVGMERNVRRRIKEFESAGNFVAAGDLLFHGDKYEDAAELYQKAGDHLRCGEALEKAGQTAKAAQAYKRAGAPVMAAEAYAKKGQFSLAAKEYDAAGNKDKAAQMYMKSSDFRSAAELFEQLERFEDAGTAYERCGQKTKAAEVWSNYFNTQYDMARGDLQRIPESLAAAIRAADILAEAGQGAEAAELFRKAGKQRRAAELFEELGMVEEAAAIYVAAKRPHMAAKLYESVGDRDKALQYRAEARLLKNDSEGAAEDFARAGEFVKAAELYLSSAMGERAAEMYLKAQEFRTAAELFKTEGNLAAAAMAFEKCADYVQAADLYAEIGDHNGEMRVAKQGNDWFRVGEVLLRFERDEDSLAAFQRVEPSDSRYQAAQLMQADLWRKLGKLDVALSRYEEIVREQKLSQQNVDIFYRMASTAMDAGRLEQAARLFESIIAVNYYYKDANKLAAQIRSQIGAPSSAHEGSGARQQPTAGSGEMPLNRQENRRYHIEHEVARGGMGVVYRARDTVLDRIVAYKILSTNLKTNDVAVKYFLREARAAAQMAHPNIVTVYDTGEQDGDFFMAMEFVEGQTLKQLVTKQGAFPERLVRYIMIQVCKGLQFAHDRGLVHRDIKPGNIMLTKDRALKIMDFGLAKFVEEVQAQHTRAIGTPYYMSPEQILGKELDGRSDIYSLGVSMFECATGQVPFSKGDLSYHHINTEPPNPREINPAITEDLSDIILKCMAKAPNDRFRDMAELLTVVRP
jgi:tetratricopeptide (TPR) repeat protein